MSRGILMYAHNNSEIDYFKIACANSLLVKKNLGYPVSIVTDSDTLAYSIKQLTKEFIDNCFDKIIVKEKDLSFKNSRNYNDATNVKSLQFYNCNHWEAYELSPYNETLFIDSDYLIMSNSLNNCWGSDYDFMIDNRIYTVASDKHPYVKYIDDTGISLYWATVIYFKKSITAEHIFNYVKHIQENYRYYKDLYSFSNGMFRNDYSFSVAIHSINSLKETHSTNIGKLPIPGLLMSWDTDDVKDINEINDIYVYGEKEDNKGQYILTRIKNTDIHIMNKWAINRISNKLIELYE